MASLSMIQWHLSDPTPVGLSAKMYDLNFLNQKIYQYSPPIYDKNLGEYTTWYLVDVLLDKNINGESYEITRQDIEKFLKVIKSKTINIPLSESGGG